MGMTEFLLVVAVGGGIIAVLFATFRGAAGEAESEARRPAADAGSASSEVVELWERERALARSLEEIEGDLEAGNLSRDDYGALKARYEGELSAVRGRLSASAGAPRPETAPRAVVAGGRSRLASAIGWGGGLLAFVALAALVMSQAVRPRGEDGAITGSLPGQDASGPATAPLGAVDQGQLAALMEAVEADPNDVEALVELGHLLLQLQRYSELAQVTEQALQLDPNNPEALTHLGMLLFTTQHPAGVIETFDRALEADPNFPEALQFKGMVSYIRGDYATAVSAWERYVSVVPPEDVSPRIKAMLAAAQQSQPARVPEPQP